MQSAKREHRHIPAVHAHGSQGGARGLHRDLAVQELVCASSPPIPARLRPVSAPKLRVPPAPYTCLTTQAHTGRILEGSSGATKLKRKEKSDTR